ncbi:MAG: phosphoribosylanthranilate isomerase [Desulfovibrio sp.]|uniref:phosphoribosylanthranilate isomerase n=1 Tax=Desulfovibrio sp. 7SRBS1 TaxID=3378064 RepID=UPI003B3C6ECC
MRLLVKICGLTRLEDVAVCTGIGADLLGFIFHPKSPRNTDPALPANVRTCGASKVGVFVSQTADEINDIMQRGKLNLAQLHGDQDPDFCRAIGANRVIKVFWPDRYETTAELEADLRRYQTSARYFLFDSGASGGGHGAAMDTTILKGLNSPLPWLLAGGLGPDNLDQALAVKPNGLDINSGVESAPGVKDNAKIGEVFRKLAGVR